MSSLKGMASGEGKSLEAALGRWRLQRKQRLDGSHDVICCPCSPSCPHNRCRLQWVGTLPRGGRQGKEGTEPGGRTPGTGRSPAQPPGGSNLAGRCAAGEQAPQRGGAQAAHGDLGEIPHSLCGSVIRFALPLTRPTRH